MLESAFPMPTGPEPRERETTHYNEGMTLLDYFAAQVMSGLISNSDTNPYLEDSQEKFNYKAEFAYRQAKAMLTARESYKN